MNQPVRKRYVITQATRGRNGPDAKVLFQVVAFTRQHALRLAAARMRAAK